MSDHAPIAPSSLALTVACNASVQLQASAPPLLETDEEALEGEAAHWLAMKTAQGVAFNVGDKFTVKGREWKVDVDMLNGARLYAKTLHDQTRGNLRLEDAVRCSRIHAEHCYGTPDAWEYFPEGLDWSKGIPVLRTGDYKYGHRFVEVFENFQLTAYTVGEMERLGLTDDRGLSVEFILVQPRCYHREGPVRRWRIPADELRALINIARGAAERALMPNPTATTGTHCLDCKARHVCGTLRETAANVVDYAGSAMLEPLDPTALGSELRILDAAFKRLEARRTGLAAMVDATLRAGQRVPHYELAPGRSNLAWLPDTTPESIGMLGDLLGIITRKPPAVITPRQAIDAGIDEAIVMQYASRPPAGLVVKPVSTTNVTKVFGK